MYVCVFVVLLCVVRGDIIKLAFNGSGSCSARPNRRFRFIRFISKPLFVPKVMIRSFVRAKPPLSKWARGAFKCRTAHTYEFDRDTSVELVEKPKKIAFRHSKGKASIIPLVLLQSSEPLSAGWSIAGAPNGGLLVAMAISAMRKAIKAAGGDHHDPLNYNLSLFVEERKRHKC